MSRSVTNPSAVLTANVYVPGVVALPLKVQVAPANVRPGGSVPMTAALHPAGELVVYLYEYAAPTAVSGASPERTVTGGATTMVSASM